MLSDADVDSNIISWNRYFQKKLPIKFVNWPQLPFPVGLCYCMDRMLTFPLLGVLFLSCHARPGTGKTSLSRALAQKLSIRLSSRYSHSRLLEINSHSLFSRWFSESGKLVQKLFASVNELCEEEDCFVVVLIGRLFWAYLRSFSVLNTLADEVESLTAARTGALAGTEPSDALRVSLLGCHNYRSISKPYNERLSTRF